MVDHIPFITGEDGVGLVSKLYPDSLVVRLPLDRADRFRHRLPAAAQVWLDPGIDGMDDLTTRRPQWLDSMVGFPNFEKIGTRAYQAKPDQAEVDAFVRAVMDECATHGPTWITVPQLPLVDDSARNRINRELASAAGRWKGSSGFPGTLILPLVFTTQDQVNAKTARNPKVREADHCYHLAQAGGLWVVDASLNDEIGSAALRNKRFRGVIALQEELNDRIQASTRIAGPYWGLNLVLWARGLVDYPAIGIGSGYQYLLAGGHVKQPSSRLALTPLRRRVGVGPELEAWLGKAISALSPLHPGHAEFSDLRRRYAALRDPAVARRQVAASYKRWFDTIAEAPKTGRSMALFQDLAAAYALGKSLPNLASERTARRPEAVAEPLMLSCL
jgi:hypothetical protein